MLITHGTRPFAQRVGKLLQPQYDVLFGSADEVSDVLLQTGRYIQLPGADTAAFEHGLLRSCLDNGIDVVVPLGEKEVGLLGHAQQLFAEYGIAIWIPDAVHPEEVNWMRNPDRHLPLMVLNRGVVVIGDQHPAQPDTLSGVFTRPTPTEGMRLCCIAD